MRFSNGMISCVGSWHREHTRRVEKQAAWASRACARFCSVEYSCMFPFTSCGLQCPASDTQDDIRTLSAWQLLKLTTCLSQHAKVCYSANSRRPETEAMKPTSTTSLFSPKITLRKVNFHQKNRLEPAHFAQNRLSSILRVRTTLPKNGCLRLATDTSWQLLKGSAVSLVAAFGQQQEHDIHGDDG